jgi:hypothetical protein
VKVCAGLGCFRGFLRSFRGSRVGFPSFFVVEESSTSFTGAVLRGEAFGGLGFGFKGVRMGDLKGLLTDPLRRRRFAGVSIVSFFIRTGERNCGRRY